MLGFLGFSVAILVALAVGFVVGVLTFAGATVQKGWFMHAGRRYTLVERVTDVDTEEGKITALVVSAFKSGRLDGEVARAVRRNMQRNRV